MPNILYHCAMLLNTDKFLELRKKANLSREHLAVRIGVSSGVVQNVETDNTHNPTLIIIAKYIEYFNVKFEELVTTTGTKFGDAF